MPTTETPSVWKRTLSRWRGESPEIDLEPFLELTRVITADPRGDRVGPGDR